MAKKAGKDKPLRVRVKRVSLDREKRALVMLATPKRVLPIWIGMFEAQAILLAMRGTKMPRPMTHDLFAGMLTDLGWKMEKLVIEDLADQTFYAKLHLASGRRRKATDCRPSDGIALAVRTKAPIYVARHVMDEGAVPVDAAERSEDEKQGREGEAE